MGGNWKTRFKNTTDPDRFYIVVDMSTGRTLRSCHSAHLDGAKTKLQPTFGEALFVRVAEPEEYQQT